MCAPWVLSIGMGSLTTAQPLATCGRLARTPPQAHRESVAGGDGQQRPGGGDGHQGRGARPSAPRSPDGLGANPFRPSRRCVFGGRLNMNQIHQA